MRMELVDELALALSGVQTWDQGRVALFWAMAKAVRDKGWHGARENRKRPPAAVGVGKASDLPAMAGARLAPENSIPPAPANVREEEKRLVEFFQTELVIDPDGRVLKRDIFARYVFWCGIKRMPASLSSFYLGRFTLAWLKGHRSGPYQGRESRGIYRREFYIGCNLAVR